MNVGELTSFAPALEIAAMRHARLEARLFRS
jgi:urease accessory protein UreF